MNRGWVYPLLAVALLVTGGGLILALSAGPGPGPVPVDITTALVPANPEAINEPIQPVPMPDGLNAARVSLGERLFHDPLLSRDGTVSCASCHDLARGGADGRVVSIGAGGTPGHVNALTVFNSALNFRFFWDGRAESLTQQLDGPMTGAAEMGATWPDVVDKLRGNDDYLRRFALAFSDRKAAPSCGKDGANCRLLVTQETVSAALVEFLRSLLTPNSRFDRYIKGDRAILTAKEKQGYELFKSYGCVACHQGVNVGGNMFQVFGVMSDYFAERGNITVADYGRFNVTGREEDRYRFRVPSLRNVALTAPYFHDGTAETLEQAVMVMARYQLGVAMPAEDLELIVVFLGTLTGEFRGEPL